MGQRPTSKAGLTKTRVSDPVTQKVLDAIIERIEVLDGLRGDSLDKAVTYRDLGVSGFTVIPGPNGTRQITNTPGTGDGPGVGAAAAPASIIISETFLALLITWTNPSVHLQHIEIWRAVTDNLSSAILLGTTVAPQFADYVGANATYYYWVRSVGTDGTFSAYNSTTGTVGITGIDPSAITIDGTGFIVRDPGAGPDITPFIVGTVNDELAVGLSGQFIVDGTIRGNSIFANTIGANHISVLTLSAISADMGVLQAGRITTGTDGTEPLYEDQTSFRVEIESQASTAFPLWYGSGAKSDITGRFYVDANGNVVVKGLLNAGMIKQSFFTPAGDDESFRIATEFPAEYSGGVYTGKKAHLFPMKTSNFHNADFRGFRLTPTSGSFPTGGFPGFFDGPVVEFIGPFNTASTEYGRLGTYSEIFMVHFDVQAYRFDNRRGDDFMFCFLQYQYDAEGWKTAWKFNYHLGSGGIGANTTFTSRIEAFSALQFRIRLEVDPSSLQEKTGLHLLSLQVWTPNFGYADAPTTDQTAGPNDPSNIPDYRRFE